MSSLWLKAFSAPHDAVFPRTHTHTRRSSVSELKAVNQTRNTLCDEEVSSLGQ